MFQPQALSLPEERETSIRSTVPPGRTRGVQMTERKQWRALLEIWVMDGWMTDGVVRRGISDEEFEEIGLN